MDKQCAECASVETVQDTVNEFKALPSDWVKMLVEAYARGIVDANKLAATSTSND